MAYRLVLSTLPFAAAFLLKATPASVHLPQPHASGRTCADRMRLLRHVSPTGFNFHPVLPRSREATHSAQIPACLNLHATG